MKGKHQKNRNGYILSNTIQREDLGAVSNYLRASRRRYELKVSSRQGDVSNRSGPVGMDGNAVDVTQSWWQLVHLRLNGIFFRSCTACLSLREVTGKMGKEKLPSGGVNARKACRPISVYRTPPKK